MHDIDNQDRFKCAVCGQAWVVPSLARQCERDDKAYQAKPQEPYKPKRVERP